MRSILLAFLDVHKLETTICIRRITPWSCPYKTGHSAFATSRINSLGDFSLNPLWG